MKTVPLIQFGLGGVGRAVVERVLAAADEYEWRYGLRLRYVALCDSQGAVVATEGVTLWDLQRALAAKGAGQSLAAVPGGYQHEDTTSIVDVAGTTGAIVIDVTASDETVDALLLALDLGYAAVTANKRPLTQDYATFRRLVGSGRFRYEATVGAGVPVIATLAENIIASHDAVHRIEGCFSGTLGYLTTGLQAGAPFSTLVGEAKAKGYTEPDPRDDLGGMDVGRKTLILARTLGWPLTMEQMQVQSLFPPELAQGSVDDFLQAIAALDGDYSASVAAAGQQGATLRYVASLSGGLAQVGLQPVPLESPLGRLQGTDNLIAFYTDIYQTSPLVVQGRGAGAHGTAAGVLADIVALAKQQR